MGTPPDRIYCLFLVSEIWGKDQERLEKAWRVKKEEIKIVEGKDDHPTQ
jgi:hypothetical protein